TTPSRSPRSCVRDCSRPERRRSTSTAAGSRVGAARTSTGAGGRTRRSTPRRRSTSTPRASSTCCSSASPAWVERRSMIVFGAIAPHGGPIFDEPESPTRKGMEELGRLFAAADPEAVIVLTPHGFQVDGHIAVVRAGRVAGDARPWTEADTAIDLPGDPELADACLTQLEAAGLPAVGVLFGTAVVQ